jgi:Asp-tRNA(Asn)/Glu-tRNA(Gln) amidotransferase A subunit family amidase
VTDLREISMAIRARQLSPVEHVRAALDALAADPFNLVVELNADRALAEAFALTEELARGGWRGPLHGVALGVKDLFDVAGLPTRCGSAVFADAAPAAEDAVAVARLRAAGAVVVAKLHTQEFAHGPTGDVSASGPARNPHDPTRITGGSSSGSAGAVAAGYVPLALGSDTGASVRVPAAHCGVVGLKPVYGHVPTTGVFPLARSLDHVGLLTADVHGAQVAWDVLDRGAEGTGGGIQAPGVRGLTLCVPADEHWAPVDPVIADAHAAAARALEKAGARIVERRLPQLTALAAAYPDVVAGEAYTEHRETLAARPQDYQPLVRERLLSVADMPAHRYVAARRLPDAVRAELRRELNGVDALLTPTTRLRATPLGAQEVDGVPVRPSLLELTSPFNMLGWAAVSVPVPPSDGGLPVGVQVAGVDLEERGVLRVAAAVESAFAG